MTRAEPQPLRPRWPAAVGAVSLARSDDQPALDKSAFPGSVCLDLRMVCRAGGPPPARYPFPPRSSRFDDMQCTSFFRPRPGWWARRAGEDRAQSLLVGEQQPPVPRTSPSSAAHAAAPRRACWWIFEVAGGGSVSSARNVPQRRSIALHPQQRTPALEISELVTSSVPPWARHVRSLQPLSSSGAILAMVRTASRLGM